MYKDFNIEVFNKEFEAGDLYGLEYIGKTIINGLKEDKDWFTRADYLKGLYEATIGLNNCVIACETGKGFITDVYIFDTYYSIRELLFQELGIEYNGEKYILNEREF